MPLYIRDDAVDALAIELQLLTRAPSKTEAVRKALKAEIVRVRQAMPVRTRLAEAKAIARGMDEGGTGQ